MRSKAFVMSMGLAASVWLTGCQSSSQLKIASSHKSSSSTVCKSGSCGDGACSACEKTESTPKTAAARLTTRKTATSSVPAAACSTGACAEAPIETADATRKGSKTIAQSAADCNSCDAKTVGKTPAIASLPMPPESVVAVSNPTSPCDLPPPPPTTKATPGAPTVVEVVSHHSLPEPTSYGPGVEAVYVPAPVMLPASIPGTAPAKEKVMTVTFGQANDYKVIVGQVYQFRRAWKLRFAAVESEDKYGGSVTLVGDNLDNLHDGQMIRVEGNVVSGDDRAGGARYQVSRVDVIEPNVK